MTMTEMKIQELRAEKIYAAMQQAMNSNNVKKAKTEFKEDMKFRKQCFEGMIFGKKAFNKIEG